MRALLTSAYGNAYVVLTLCAMSWGGNAVAGRMAVGEVSPMLLTLLRWTGVVLLVALFARQAVASQWPVLRPRLPYLAGMGALGFTLFNVLYYVAAHRTSGINLGVLQGSVPVLVLLGTCFFHGAPIRALQVAGISVTLTGVAVVTSRGDLAGLMALQFNAGDLLMLAACAVYAAYTVALKHRPDVPGMAMFGVMAAAAALASLPFAGWELWSGAAQWPASVTGWTVVAFVIVFPSFLAQLMFMRGVQLIGPSRAGVFINLVPVFAASFSVTMLGEHFAAFQAVALTLVLGGIALAERGRR
jgi:drug/metabolite transporter (DMT)-like permease